MWHPASSKKIKFLWDSSINVPQNLNVYQQWAHLTKRLHKDNLTWWWGSETTWRELNVYNSGPVSEKLKSMEASIYCFRLSKSYIFNVDPLQILKAKWQHFKGKLNPNSRSEPLCVQLRLDKGNVDRLLPNQYRLVYMVMQWD